MIIFAFMQKILILLLFCASFLESFAQKAQQFDYEIEPVIAGNQSHFIINIAFKEKEDGELQLQLPRVWGMDPHSDFLKIVNVENAQLAQNDSVLSVKYKKNTKVKITYRLINAVEDSIPGRGQEYLPVIKPTYFTLFTNSGFLMPVPKEGSADNYNFSISWKNYPEQYRSKPITSFGNGLKQELKSVPAEELLNGILVGGDYRLYHQVNDKKQATDFAIRGKWAFKDADMGTLVASVLSQQRKFWDDYSTKRYLITISAGGYENESEQSYTGTGLHNSFAVTAVCNNTTQVHSLNYLFHHELMHHWIGNQIKNGVDEELSYWFSEGFTDYFARKNMYESGLITKAEYNALLDSIFAIHYNNPLAGAPNDSIKPHFWDGSYYGKMPYNRGSIFAYYLDGKILQLSGWKYDLKTVMRIMLSQTADEKRQFDWHWMQQEIQKLVNYDITPDIRKYILNGEPISIETWNETYPDQLELKPVRVFAPGFMSEKDTETGKTFVTGVEKNSGIEAGGLKVGDQIITYSIYWNTYEQSDLTIIRDGKEMILPFYAYVLSQPLPQHIKK